MVPIHRKKFEKNTLRSLLISQTKFIKDIFVKCGVPDSIEGICAKLRKKTIFSVKYY